MVIGYLYNIVSSSKTRLQISWPCGSGPICLFTSDERKRDECIYVHRPYFHKFCLIWTYTHDSFLDCTVHAIAHLIDKRHRRFAYSKWCVERRMSDIITSCLQLQKNISTNRIVVKEINGCDGSFIVNCVISYCIKQNSPLLIVSSHNSITHYHNVGLRMNHNLFKSCEAGVIDYFDFGDATLTNIMEYAESDQLLIDVLKKIEEMQRNHDTVNIIFDGITHLLDLQYTLQEVNKFCSEIIEIAAKSKNPFVIFHCNDVMEDDANHCLANLLSHKAQTVVEVENLSSGLSSDVSGHLTIKYPGNKFNEEHIHTVDMKPKKYLYKLFDRGVKLLAPGTV